MDRRGVRLPRPGVRDRARSAPPRARDRTPAAERDGSGLAVGLACDRSSGRPAGPATDHRGALRPGEPVLPDLARRDHDLFLGVVRTARHDARGGAGGEVPADRRRHGPATRDAGVGDRVGVGWVRGVRGERDRVPCHHDHRVEGTSGVGGTDGGGAAPTRPGRGSAGGLRGHDRVVRRRDLDRDDRIHPGVALARVLPNRARSSGARRPGGPPDHHGGRPTLGVIEHQPGLHPTIRVPREPGA